MRKYDTIIWDMDGTLLNTLDDLTDSVNEALLAFSLPLRTKSEIRAFIGNGVARLMELSVPDGRHNPRFEQIFAFFISCYDKNYRSKTKPYDGLSVLLTRMKASGYKMAIVSNKIDSALKELTALHFSDTISVSIGDYEGVRRKPYPDKVFEALRILETDKNRAVYIGDTEVDIETARNAGIDCICVSWGFRDKNELEKAGAACIIDTPQQLAELLE